MEYLQVVWCGSHSSAASFHLAWSGKGKRYQFNSASTGYVSMLLSWKPCVSLVIFTFGGLLRSGTPFEATLGEVCREQIEFCHFYHRASSISCPVLPLAARLIFLSAAHINVI